jgi:hypothetical protein
MSPSWEASSYSFTHEIKVTLWNSKAQYEVAPDPYPEPAASSLVCSFLMGVSYFLISTGGGAL